MEFRSDDDSVPKDGYIATYTREFAEATASVGLKDQAESLEGYLRDAGFVDVKLVIKKMPIGPWPKGKKFKQIGHFAYEVVREGTVTYPLALFTKFYGRSAEEVKKTSENICREVRAKGCHPYNEQ